MKHLSVEEIIKYVTASKLDSQTLDLLSDVNAHVRECEVCREKVQAFQTMSDQLYDSYIKQQEYEMAFEKDALFDEKIMDR